MAAAVDARLINASPVDRVPLPTVEFEEMRFLTIAEVMGLADAIDERYRAMLLVAAFGGLRLGELVGLRRCRVDADRGRIEIVETGVEAGGRVRFGPPKTRAGRRTVSLPKIARVALAEHLDTRVEPVATALVLTAPSGGLCGPRRGGNGSSSQRSRLPGSCRCACTIFATPRSVCGLRQATTPRKCPDARGTRRWHSRSTATATYTRTLTSVPATAWTS
jgi:integrase